MKKKKGAQELVREILKQKYNHTEESVKKVFVDGAGNILVSKCEKKLIHEIQVKTIVSASTELRRIDRCNLH